MSDYPQTFEDLDQSHGFMIYETVINDQQSDPVLLSIPGLADRATVFIDQRPVGILSRTEEIFNLPLQILPGERLTIVVENQGRICYGPQLADRKGIIGNVTLGGQAVRGWTMSSLALDDGDKLLQYVQSIQSLTRRDKHVKHELGNEGLRAGGKMTFWSGEFQLGNNVGVKDSFLSLSGWHKGVVFINGFHLGRYWPVVGPQVTLYVPADILKPHPETNSIVLLEQVEIILFSAFQDYSTFLPRIMLPVCQIERQNV